jgi:chromosome segregation ATPase
MYGEASMEFQKSEVKNAGIKQLKKVNGELQANCFEYYSLEERLNEIRQELKMVKKQKDYFEKNYNRLMIMFDELQREYRIADEGWTGVQSEYEVVTKLRLELEKELFQTSDKLKKVEKEFEKVKKQRNEFSKLNGILILRIDSSF